MPFLFYKKQVFDFGLGFLVIVVLSCNVMSCNVMMVAHISICFVFCPEGKKM